MMQSKTPKPYPPSWKPLPGDLLIGRVVGYRSVNTRFGWRVIVTVEDEEGGEVTVWLSDSALIAEFERERPWLGDSIRLWHMGPHEFGGFDCYRLTVDRNEDGVGWVIARAEQKTPSAPSS